ncbi:MAG: helix-turn-helix domain-containing protein [Clostridiales bacterium]|nr:helix-turn-helix domain-containing protein [Clostridiales bacterium]
MKKFSSFYFKTGDFAALAGLNKRTLHYYDEIGLFRPSHVGENGYRYYAVNQLDQLALIVTLRDLGVSLKDIRACLESRDAEMMNRFLEAQNREIDRLIRQLEQRKGLLQSVLDSNRLFQRYLDNGYPVLSCPAEPYALLLDFETEPARAPEERVIVNYLTDGPYTGLCIRQGRRFLFQKRKDGDGCIPAGDYLCRYSRIPAGESQADCLNRQAEALRAQAAARQLLLEDCFYVEFNDTLAQSCGQADYFSIRARILEGAVTAGG